MKSTKLVLNKVTVEVLARTDVFGGAGTDFEVTTDSLQPRETRCDCGQPETQRCVNTATCQCVTYKCAVTQICLTGPTWRTTCEMPCETNTVVNCMEDIRTQ